MKKEFEKHEIILNKGEKIYLTTDGVFDMQSPNRKKFGRIQFMELLQANCQKTLDCQYNEIINAIKKHQGDETQIDDITIMGIEL